MKKTTAIILALIVLLGVGMGVLLYQKNARTGAKDAGVLQNTVHRIPFISDAPCDGSDPTLVKETLDTSKKYTYQNAAYGVMMDIPYDPQWLSSTYQVSSYEEEKNPDGMLKGIMFGRPICASYEAPPNKGVWIRTLSMEFLPAQSLKDSLARYKKELAHDITIYSGSPEDILKVVKVNSDISIIDAHPIGGLCGTEIKEIVGTKYNYKFEEGCGVNDNPAIVDAIIRSMHTDFASWQTV